METEFEQNRCEKQKIHWITIGRLPLYIQAIMERLGVQRLGLCSRDPRRAKVAAVNEDDELFVQCVVFDEVAKNCPRADANEFIIGRYPDNPRIMKFMHSIRITDGNTATLPRKIIGELLNRNLDAETGKKRPESPMLLLTSDEISDSENPDDDLCRLSYDTEDTGLNVQKLNVLIYEFAKSDRDAKDLENKLIECIKEIEGPRKAEIIADIVRHYPKYASRIKLETAGWEPPEEDLVLAKLGIVCSDKEVLSPEENDLLLESFPRSVSFFCVGEKEKPVIVFAFHSFIKQMGKMDLNDKLLQAIEKATNKDRARIVKKENRRFVDADVRDILKIKTGVAAKRLGCELSCENDSVAVAKGGKKLGLEQIRKIDPDLAFYCEQLMPGEKAELGPAILETAGDTPNPAKSVDDMEPYEAEKEIVRLTTLMEKAGASVRFENRTYVVEASENYDSLFENAGTNEDEIIAFCQKAGVGLTFNEIKLHKAGM